MSSDGRTPPKTTQAALRHFGIVENKRTPVLHVFEIWMNKATVGYIRRMFKRLAIILHPDRCGRIDRRGTERAIRIIMSPQFQ